MSDESDCPADDVESAGRAVVAVWRIEAARVVATLTRYTGDFALAEDLAQEALTEALEKWPVQGAPRNGAAWLTQVGKRRAIDHWRRQERYAARLATLGEDLEREQDLAADELPWVPMRSAMTCCVWSSSPVTLRYRNRHRWR